MFLSQSFNHSQLFSELASLEHKKSLKAICISSWLEQDYCKVARSFWRASGPSPKNGKDCNRGNQIEWDYNWHFMSTCEVCVNSVAAAAGWAWSGGKGVEQYVLDEEMLHNSLQKKGWNQRCCSPWIVYAWIVVENSEDFLDLSLCLSCMFELPNHDVEIQVKMLGSEFLFQITLSLLQICPR